MEYGCYQQMVGERDDVCHEIQRIYVLFIPHLVDTEESIGESGHTSNICDYELAIFA